MTKVLKGFMLSALALLVAGGIALADDGAADGEKRCHKRPGARVKARFDKDGDGKLNEQERAAAKEALKKRAKKHPKLRQRILEKFDADGDGKLNDEEKAAAKEALKKFRQNRKRRCHGGDGDGAES